MQYKYLLIIFTAFALVGAATWLVVRHFLKPKPDPNGGGGGSGDKMFKEVFVVKLKGHTKLNPALLMAGFRYAYSAEIDEALKDGLSIPGVKSSDYAMYLADRADYKNKNPNIYICKDGDFSTNKNINWPTKHVGDNKTHTFWAFLYGYKPIKSINYPITHYINRNMDIKSHKLLPWNSKSWNTTSPKNAESINKKEVILLHVGINGSFQISQNSAKSVLTKNGYDLATQDQIYWSISQGLSAKYTCLKVIRDSGTDFVTPSKCVTYPYDPPTPKICSGSDPCNFQNVAVWGNKKTFPKKLNPTFANNDKDTTVKVLKFNDKKNSMYDK